MTDIGADFLVGLAVLITIGIVATTAEVLVLRMLRHADKEEELDDRYEKN